MAALHGLDLLWFLGAWLLTRSMAESLQTVIKRFIVYDIGTLVLFGGSLGAFHANYGAPYAFQWSCLAVLLIVGGIDFWQNRDLYRGEALHGT